MRAPRRATRARTALTGRRRSTGGMSAGSPCPSPH